MYIKLEYSFGQSILIKLFDIPVVVEWFNKYSKHQTDYTEFHINSSQYSLFRKIQHIVYPSYAKSKWSTIKLSFQKLKALGYQIPFDIPDQFDFDQNTLNKLHRFFTYNILWYDSKDQNPFDNTFQTDISYSDWHALLDVINRYVHFLEVVVTNENKKILDQYSIDCMQYHLLQQTTDTWLPFNQAQQQQNFKYFDYTEHPLVLLDNSILGKSVLSSFLDNDNPTYKDCTGRLGSHGGFIIDLNNNRKKIYQSDNFKTWTTRYNLTNMPLEFPIGYVVNYQHIKLITRLKFKRAIFSGGP